MEPMICYTCSSKSCEKTEQLKLDICDYGVAYYNNGNNIEKKEDRITLRDISTNLRHELHKVLQTIIVEANAIDPLLSTRRIDLEKPASRILGATIIIDQFIEMITGVHNFHPDISNTKNIHKKTNLFSIVKKYVDIFSLIQNSRRAKDLEFNIEIDGKIVSSLSSNIIEYIVSILVDNVWKYSVEATKVNISLVQTTDLLVELQIKNISNIINDVESIFEKGYQGKKESEGFGYGLYWLQLLVNYYNRTGEENEIVDSPLIVEHRQNILDENVAEQTFIIRNIRFEK